MANIDEIEARLTRERFPQVQFCMVFAGAAVEQEKLADGWEVIVAQPDALVPELWRDGIKRARAEKVALTTTQCIPSPTWVAELLATDLSTYAGIGGAIDLDQRCNAVESAIYFLRYSNYAPSRSKGVVNDIAADNAVYRVADILKHADLLETGFWEPSFHRRYAALGERLKFDPALTIAYRGRERAGEFVRARLSHGREYGASRAATASPMRKLGLILASPAIPLVILGRVVCRTLGRPRMIPRLLVATPALVLFLLAWSAGEARGYLDALQKTTGVG